MHRTLPTWAREPLANGNVQWRIYYPHRAGGAVYVIHDATPDMSRTEVAAKLRQYRRVLTGRDKHEGDAGGADIPPVAETVPPAPAAEFTQASLF